MSEENKQPDYYSYIKANEGLRLKKYKDSEGNPTIGIGHLIKKGEKLNEITEAKAKQLFNVDIKEKIDYVKNDIDKDLGKGAFDAFPNPIKISLIDLDFRGDYRQSPKAIGLFKEGKYYAAAKELLNNDDYRKSLKQGTGIAPRMERNIKPWVDLGNAKTLKMPFDEAASERIRLLDEQK
tara:strand:+ start:959 stop:1498 length:540 start_codon:yes stop_codon:yes gene_type:complete